MNESHLGSFCQSKTIKTEGIETEKSKSKFQLLSCLKKLLNLITCIFDVFLSIITKMCSCLSTFSLLVQLSLYLIPLSIILIILIYFIHVEFYNDIFLFNMSKTIKEEFLDLYITQIDDLKAEITSLILKDTKLDLENQLFFQIYFKELASVGFLNTESCKTDEKFLPKMNEEEASFYTILNKYNGINVNFSIHHQVAEDVLEKKSKNNLGGFVKLYYYMFPYMWYETLSMSSLINQSFIVVYEFDDENRYLKDYEIFFRYPKSCDQYVITNNFIADNYILNPRVSWTDYYIEDYEELNFYTQNWFKPKDYDFRESVNTEEDSFIKISLAHLNRENDGFINKTFISYSQQYIQNENRHFIISIIFFFEQLYLQEGDNDYSSFVIKENISDIEEQMIENERFSNNISYVLTISDSTEYSMTEMDFRFFHLGLYENYYTFYMNGVLYDSFNLQYFSNYKEYYSTAKEGENDLKFYVSLYLYKCLFQNIKFDIIKKQREEIFLYHFEEENKVKEICERIDFNSYRNYLKESGIDCWDKRNQLFYDSEDFKYFTMENDSDTIDPIYPYCSCLPLYCLKNYKNLDENLDNLEFSSEINLPNKCQNKFTKYETLKEHIEYRGNNKLLRFIHFSFDSINYDFIKIIFLQLNQLPGYFFFIIAHIKSSGEAYIHRFYKSITKVEIIIFILSIFIILSILTIVVIFNSIKKYSLAITNFKKKYELFIFHSLEYDEETNSKNNNNITKYLKIKDDKKQLKEQSIDNENLQPWETESLISKDFCNINDNTLLEDLFLIFSETYNINMNDIEKFISQRQHESKNQMKLNMMKEKNELFELLSSFCLHAPLYKLILNFDYNMYEYSEIIKKYNHYGEQSEKNNKEQKRLTQNILYELISTECINDYGLITNFNFAYITNKESNSKKNSIQYAMFENIKNKQQNNILEEENENDDIKIKKLVLKRKNILIELLKNRFESDDFLNYNKLENVFNFFLINSYYKYSRQIGLENNAS